MITEASKQCANATENGNSSGSLTWNCPSLRHPAPSGLLPIGAGSAAGRPGGRARQNRTLTNAAQNPSKQSQGLTFIHLIPTSHDERLFTLLVQSRFDEHLASTSACAASVERRSQRR